MGKLSDFKDIGKNVKEINETVQETAKKGSQTKLPSGGGKPSPQDELIRTMIGGLFGKPEANMEQPIIAYIKANKQKTQGKSIGELILGLQGGLDEGAFSKMMEGKKKFFEDMEKIDFSTKFKKFADVAIKFMADDATWLQDLKDSLEEANKKQSEEGGEAKIDVEGGSDFQTVLKAISEFKLDKETKKSLEELADMTGKDGCITAIFDNIHALNKKNVDFDAFNANMKKMDKAAKESAELGEKVDENKMKKSAKGMISFGDFMLGVIAVGLLFVVIGLLGNFLDYGAIIKFSAILLLFMLGLTGIFVMANKALKKGGDAWNGVEQFIKLVIASAFILILGGLAMKIIEVGELFKFAGTLLLFLLGLSAIYAIMNAVAKGVMQGVKDFTLMVIASAVIMILGAMLNKFIPFEDVIGFTIKLGLFLLMLAGVFFVWNLAKIATGHGIRDAIIAVGMAAFIMFLGALTAKLISWADLAQFLFMLGTFLFGILIVMFVASMALKVEKGLIRETVLLVVAATFVLLLGSLAMEYLEIGDILAFIGLLTLFIGGILAAMGLVAKFLPLEKLANVGLKDIAIFVGTMAAIMIIGGFVMMIPGMWKNLLGFTVLFGLFLLAMMGIFKLMTMILKDIEVAKMCLKDLTIFVGSMAAIMILGGLSMKIVGIGDILLFTALFAAFLAAIGLIITGLLWLWEEIKMGDLALKDLSIFVAAMGFTMLGGALILKLFPDLWSYCLLFTGMFSLFLVIIGGIITVLMEMAPEIKEGNESMKELGIFVAIAGATMLGGGLILMFFPDLPGYVALFGVMLLAFVGAMFLVMALINKKIGEIQKGNMAMMDLAKFVAISAATILAGGFVLMTFPALVKWVPIFAAMLLAFVGLMVVIYKLLAKKLDPKTCLQANMAMKNIQKTILITSIAFGILALVYKVVEKAGGVKGFSALIACVVGTIAALAGMMILVGKLLKEAEAKKAEIAMLCISGVLVIVSIAFGILAKVYESVMKTGGLDKFKELVWLVVAVIGVLSGGIVLLAACLGIPFVAAGAMLAIGVVLAATGAFLMVAMGVEKIAHAFEVLSKIKKLDIGPIVDACKDMVGIIDAMAPLMDKKWVIIAVADVVDELAYTISTMAEAVKEYADLKIKIYEGTKHVGYRHLKKKDFKQAATNVSLIVTSLTEGIMQAYEAHPDWYGGLKTNGSLLDFLKSVWMQNDKETPLEKVIRQSLKLAPLITQIAEAVKEYADLKIKTYTGAEHTGYKELKKKDFKQAAENISLTIETLTTGIMNVYEAHPDWYGDINFKAASLLDFIKSVWAHRGNETPLEKVIRQNLKLAPLISKIAEAVEEVANLKFATKWDDEGKPIKFKVMKKGDFKNAASNISLTVETLVNGLMAVHDAHPEWYGSLNYNSVEDFMSSLWQRSTSSEIPLEKVIRLNMKLGPLISEIAKSLADYAELKFAVKWNDQGQPIKFKQMGNKDFENAGTNISKVLTIITEALMAVYELGESKGWYDGGGFLGLGDSPFAKVLENNFKISELISNVAQSITKYAQLMIPDKWDKEGKAISFHPMTVKEFEDAGAGIGKVLSTTTMAIMGFGPEGNANDYRRIVEDYILEDDDDFNTIIESSKKTGELISGMADGISKYAQLLIPDKWDRKTGTPIHFTRMTGEMMADAGEGIGKIITTVSMALVNLWNSPSAKTVFGWDPEEEEWIEDAPITHIIEACTNMGGVISGISEGLIKYSQLRIPKRWDKNGNPIAFEKVDKSVFTEAANNVTEIVTLLAGTFIGIYNADPKMFQARTRDLAEIWDEGEDDTRSPFEIVMDASLKMSAVVGDIAKTLTMFADKKIVTGGKNGEKTEVVAITAETLALAELSVTQVLTNVANTFVKLSKPPYSTYFSDETIEQIVEPIGAMMQVVGTMSTSLQNLAQLRIPIKWNEEGNPIDFRVMNTGDFMMAGINIRLILSAIGDAFLSIATDPRATWVTGASEIKKTTSDWLGRKFTETVQTESEGNDITPIIEGMSALATILSVVSGCIYGYATMRFPLGTDKDGDMTYSEPLDEEDIQKCKDNIVMVVSTLAESMYNITQDQWIIWLSGEDGSQKVEDANAAITQATETIQGTIDGLKQMVDSESVKNVKTIDTALKNLIPTMTSIIGHISDIISLFFDENAKYGVAGEKTVMNGTQMEVQKINKSFYDMLSGYEEKMDDIPNKFRSFTNMLTDMCTSIQDMTDPIKESMGEINELYKIFTKDKFNDKFQTIIINIAGMLGNISGITKLDKLFLNSHIQTGETTTWNGLMTSLSGNVSAEDKENIDKSIKSLKSRMETYADLIVYIIQKLKTVNENMSNMTLPDASAFSTAISNFFAAVRQIEAEMSTTKGLSNLGFGNFAFTILVNDICRLNRALAGINQRSVNSFKQQNNEIAKLVKTINTAKMQNLIKLNQFANSMNRLAARMGNLDGLTKAISNKLTTVLDKLVKRLEHAEQTIVKADEIQKRRHELIQKATQEVKTLMETPMKVEIAPSADMAAMAAGAGGGAETGDANAQDQNSETNNTNANNDTKKTDADKAKKTDAAKTNS